MRTALVLLSSLVSAAVADRPVINTPPSLVQCLPSQVSFSGGTPPYYITVIPGGQINAAPLQDLGQNSQSPLVWVVPQAAGTAVTLQIRDSDGQLNYSQEVTVQPGKTDCTSSSPTTSTAASSPSGPSTPAAGPNASTTSNPAAGHNTPANNNSANAHPAASDTSHDHTPAAHTNTTNTTSPTSTTSTTNTTTPSTTNSSSPATTTPNKSPSIFTNPPTSPASASTATSTPAAGASSSAPASFKLSAHLIAVAAAGVTMVLSA